MALHGHPRSLILAPFKSAYATNRKRMCDFLLVISSNLGAILPRFRDILQVFCTPIYSVRIFLGCSLLTRLPMLGLRGTKTLIIANDSSKYFRTNPIIYLHEHGTSPSQTDGRTERHGAMPYSCRALWVKPRL